MTVSVSTLAAFSLSANSLPGALDAKGSSKEAKTDAFQNVLDSLTLFEDLEGQAGAKQQSETPTGASTKKDRSVDDASGTEAVLVPQAPRQVPPKLALVASRLVATSLDPSTTEPDNGPRASDTAGSNGQSGTATTEIVAPAQTAAVLGPIGRLSSPGVSTRKDNPEASQKIAPQAPRSSVALAGPRQAATNETAAPSAMVGHPPVPVSNGTDPKPQTTTSVSTNIERVAAQPTSDQAAPSAPLDDTSPRENPVKSAGVVTASDTKTSSKAPGNVAPRPQVVDQTRHLGPSKAPLASNSKLSAAPISKSPATSTSSFQMRTVVGRPGASQPVSPQRVPSRDTSAELVTQAPRTQAAPQEVKSTSPTPSASVQPSFPQQPFPQQPFPQQTFSQQTFSQHAALKQATATSRVVPPAVDTQSAPTTSSPASVGKKSDPDPAGIETAAPVQTTAPSPNASPSPLPTPGSPAVIPTPVPARVDSGGPEAVTNKPVASSDAGTNVSLPQHEALVTGPVPKIPLLHEAENFAFAVRMLEPEEASSREATPTLKPLTNNSDTPVAPAKAAVAQPASPAAQQPHASQSQPAGEPQHAAASPSVAPDKPSSVTKSQPDLLAPQQKAEVAPHASDAPVFQAPQADSASAGLELGEHSQTSVPLAAQDAHLLAAEPPKTSMGSEILLHLGDGSQSSAAIRIADRAGSVNVSVHAADPVLRESLRSNLGELSAQLNQQGWKADVVKTAVAATHPESQQDSHPGQSRGNQQQQPSNGDRPQRDRRGNNGQWRQELEQQTSGGSARPGGNR